MSWQHDSKRGNRHQRGYGTLWDKMRAAVLMRDNYLCQVCKANGYQTPATEVDHILSKAHGGTDEPTNLQAICTQCHQHKTAKENGSNKASYNAEGEPIDPDHSWNQ